jgi:CheY-like chemotaxis protein
MHEVPDTVAKSYGSLRILLAEDSLFNRKLAVALLEGQQHHVTVATNGQEAVQAVLSESFDLVLMDVQMPILDGLEATAKIRARERETGTHVPIIAMTAHALKGDRERCLEAGMDGYVAKPIRARELFAVIEQVVGG